jgi:putative transposase
MLFVRKYDPAIHHRKSIRLRGYDYSRKGRYFVTLCCQGREQRFGKIENGVLILNDAGHMIEKWFNVLPGKFPDIALGASVIMPNHFHAIIINTGSAIYPVGADLRVRPDNRQLGDHVGSPLPRVIQWFKTMTTNEYIRGVKNLEWERFDGKLWQRDYYEHIIRDEKSYLAITNYIINNPANWKDDEYYR